MPLLFTVSSDRRVRQSLVLERHGERFVFPLARLLVLVGLLSSLASVNAAESAEAPQAASSASIVANPNPARLSASGLRATTISWTTGSGAAGVVLVTVDGGSETLFTQGAEGSVEVDWIRSSSRYEFRLYTDTQPRDRLAVVHLEPRLTPEIVADPNPVPARDGRGTTTIAWDMGDGSGGQVLVVRGGGPPALFASGSSGTAVADWIEAKHKYEFLLHRTEDRTSPIASVVVTRELSESPGSRVSTVAILVLVVALATARALRRSSPPPA